MKIGEWVRVRSLVPGTELWGIRAGRSDFDQLEPFRLAARRLAIDNSDLNRLMVFVIGTQIANRDELVLLVADDSRQARSGQFLAEEVVDSGCL